MEIEHSHLNILVAGCLHGCWKTLYDEVIKRGNVDLVLVNGDCETFRNKKDYLSSTNATKQCEDKSFQILFLLDFFLGIVVK